MSEAQQKFTRARSQLLLKQPFFGTLCLRLKPIETEEVPTAGTDGKRLLYNPKFFLSLTGQQRVGLLAHEVMHVVFMHMVRLHERDPYLWNVAGDYVINLVVRDAGLQLPQTDLIDDKYANMTTDQIYAELQKNPPPAPEQLVPPPPPPKDKKPAVGGESGGSRAFNAIKKFAKNNPQIAAAGGLAGYDMGKGILSKIMKMRKVLSVEKPTKTGRISAGQ